MSSQQDESGVLAQLSNLTVDDSAIDNLVNNTPAMETRYKITTGFDFSTLTSAAYTCYDRKDPKSFSEAGIETIECWPGLNGVTHSIPIPTTVAFTNDRPSTVLYGFDATVSTHSGKEVFKFENFKSLLHESPETAPFNEALRQRAAKMGVTGSKIISSFIRRIVTYIIKHFRSIYGSEILSRAKLLFNFGLPPCLTSREVYQFHGYCTEAGLGKGNLAFASEVEGLLMGAMSVGYIPKPVSDTDSSFRPLLTVPKIDNSEDTLKYLVVDGGKLTVVCNVPLPRSSFEANKQLGRLSSGRRVTKWEDCDI